MIFSALLFIVSIVAGAVAAISGFGIGSLLTPVLTPHYGIKAAVTMASVPHLVGTAARFLTMKSHVDRKVSGTSASSAPLAVLSEPCCTRAPTARR